MQELITYSVELSDNNKTNGSCWIVNYRELNDFYPTKMKFSDFVQKTL